MADCRETLERSPRATMMIRLLCLGVLAVGLRPLDSSYWLDECGTVWLVSGGWRETIPRSVLFLQPPLPALLLTAVAEVFGTGEVAMRLPSVLGVVLACWLLFRLADRWFDRETALCSLAVFVGLPEIEFMMADARPYALALPAIIAQLDLLERALTRGAWRDFFGFAACAALTIHCHLLFIYFLAVPGLALLTIGRKSLRVHWRRWLIATCFALVLIAPLYWHYRVMFAWSSEKSWLPAPEYLAIFPAGLPSIPLVYFAGGLIVAAGIARTLRIESIGFDRRALSLAALSFAVPLLLLFGVSRWTTTRLFLERYLTPRLPGIALLTGALFRPIGPGTLRNRSLLFGLVGLIVVRLATGTGQHTTEDWRSAMARAAELGRDRDSVLAIYTGYIETKSLARLTDPAHLSYILSVETAYPTSIRPVIALPFQCNEPARQHWESQFNSMNENRSRLIVVLRGSEASSEWSEHLVRRLPDLGFHHTQHQRFGDVELLEFSRP